MKSCKKSFIGIGLIALTTLTAFTSQRSISGLAKFQKAIAYYEAKKYAKALELLEEAKPSIRGKREEISAHFYQAYCRFYRKSYTHSADDFEYFYQTFPKDPRAEEALYMQGYALYLSSPDERLTQNVTYEAVNALEDYLKQYPTGLHQSQVSEYLETLNKKLAHKAFCNAALYHKLTQYQAAVVALQNFQYDFPNSPWDEMAAYLKADAQYRSARVVPHKDYKEHLVTALKYCREFLDSFPDSHHTVTVEKVYQNCLSLIEAVISNTKP